MVTEPEDICVQCGKLGGDSGVALKKCSSCHLVRYCSVECQRSHRPAHKKTCQEQAAKQIEEMLFADPPESEECPVCLLRLPINREQILYQSCCGQTICTACLMGISKAAINGKSRPMDVLKGHECPLCRTRISLSLDVHAERMKKRIELGDPSGMYNYAMYLLSPIPRKDGMGPSASIKTARDLLIKASDAGCTLANVEVGTFMYRGLNPALFPQDIKKAQQYFQKAAIAGNPTAHTFLAEIAFSGGDPKKGCKHSMMAAKMGDEFALQNVTNGYKNDCVTKDEYASTLRAYQRASDELKSENRTNEEKRIDGCRAAASDPKAIDKIQQRMNALSSMMENIDMTRRSSQGKTQNK
jgi:hypothetical protein